MDAFGKDSVSTLPPQYRSLPPTASVMKHSFLITRGDLYVCVDQDVVSRSPGSGRPCGDAQTGILALAHAAAHRNLQGRQHTVLLLPTLLLSCFPLP